MNRTEKKEQLIKKIATLLAFVLLLASRDNPVHLETKTTTDQKPFNEIPKSFDPYNEVYTQEIHSMPTTSSYLGSEYLSTTKLFRNEAINITKTRQVENEKWACTLSPTNANTLSETLDILNFFKDGNNIPVYLGAETIDRLIGMSFDSENVTYIWELLLCQL